MLTRISSRVFRKRILVLAAPLAIGACSHRDVYNAVQQDQQLDCQRYPDARYEECMARVSKPYDEYDRELKSLDEEKQ